MGVSDSKVIRNGDWEHKLCWTTTNPDQQQPGQHHEDIGRSSKRSSESSKRSGQSFKRQSAVTRSINKYTGIALRGPRDRVAGETNHWRMLRPQYSASDEQPQAIEMTSVSSIKTTSTQDSVLLAL
jgi:hypothetical protein